MQILCDSLMLKQYRGQDIAGELKKESGFKNNKKFPVEGRIL